jgi:hypothetical protein
MTVDELERFLAAEFPEVFHYKNGLASGGGSMEPHAQPIPESIITAGRH